MKISLLEIETTKIVEKDSSELQVVGLPILLRGQIVVRDGNEIYPLPPAYLDYIRKEVVSRFKESKFASFSVVRETSGIKRIYPDQREICYVSIDVQPFQ